ncbi:MAG: hypothetical protein ACPGVI_00480 [Crocinitomicaceae bacterium]
MKNIAITTLFLFGVIFAGCAQNFGFIGKKNIISVYSTANPRIIPALDVDLPLMGSSNGYSLYKYDGNNVLKTRNKVFRYDFRFSYKRILSQRLGLGLDLGYEKLNLPRTKWKNYGSNYPFESTPVFNVFSTMLVLDLYSSNGISGVGLITSFGIGPKIFKFSLNENYRFNEETPMFDENISVVGVRRLIALDAFFDLTYRVPLNRTFMFDVGMRIRSGYVFREKSTYGYNEGINYYVEDLRTENIGSFVNFKMGISCIL